ncbi:S41 family peptidase [Candidatus Saccharibacteria bacterium]|nr:S41 family peptidase [Candidatus Saccharibacteria bacterium]
MQDEADKQPAILEKRRKKGRFLPRLSYLVLALAIFTAGWLAGCGRLQVRQYGAVSSNSGLPDKLDLSSVDSIYQSLKNNFDGTLDEAALLDGIKSGLAKATGDPYTEYFNAEGAEEFTNEIDGVFEGIGAQLGKDADNNIIIISPLSGYPAERAGLKPKDIIAQIDGETAYDLTIGEAVDKIRGEKGTTVILTIVRDGKPIEIPVVREQIDVPSVKSEIKDGIGVIEITRFGDDTVELARKAAQDFKAANVKGIVLDLRGNPGGYLEGSVDVASLWLDKGTTILTERRENVVINTISAKGNPLLKGIPTIVLIDEGSASASEILAGALKDNNAATLIGQKSFGKGSVQQPVNLRDGGLLKVTIARWFTPAGKNIDKEGIEPDTAIELKPEDVTAGRDPQLDAAIAKLR